jgi:aspartate carbamoyltransferase regulatory subunit
MPNLRDFLSKDLDHKIEEFDTVEGSFKCQNSECTDLTSEAFFF